MGYKKIIFVQQRQKNKMRKIHVLKKAAIAAFFCSHTHKQKWTVNQYTYQMLSK